MEFLIKGNFFDGQYILPATSGLNSVDRVIHKYSPADLVNHLWELPVDYSIVDAMTDSAKRGFELWRRFSFESRVLLIKQFQARLLQMKDEVARAISLEMGKPFLEAQEEVAHSAALVKFIIAHLEKQNRELQEKNKYGDAHSYSMLRPLGPVLIITPFNYPCYIAIEQIVYALMIGNSVIWKPSEKCAYTAQLVMDIFEQISFPSQVLNLAQGDGELAKRFCEKKEIKSILFTGSTEVGRSILAKTHHEISKLVALELGGKNYSLIGEDEKIDDLIDDHLKAAYLTTGQRCTSTSVVVLHRSRVEEFLEKFHKSAKTLVVDHPFSSEAPFMGPLIDQKAMENYLLYVGMAKREGLEEVMRGKQLQKEKKGFYVSPSIHFMPRYKAEANFLSTEIFAPSVTVIGYEEFEEGIKIVNDSSYGLVTSLYSKNVREVELAKNIISTGLLNINLPTTAISAKQPFVGMKNSGNLRALGSHTWHQLSSPFSIIER